MSSILFVGDSSGMEKLSNDVSQFCEITSEVMWNFMFADNRDNPQEFIKKNPYIVSAWVEKSFLSDDTYSLLHCGVEHDRVSEVKALLEAGDVHINTATEKNKYTPLHMVKSKEMAELLLGHGAELEEQDIEGDTPLSHVLFHRMRSDEYSRTIDVKYTDEGTSDELRYYLLQQGANPSVVDNRGYSLLHRIIGIGFRQGYPYKYITLLMRFGADIELEDLDGKTAYEYAIERKSNTEMVVDQLRRCNILAVKDRLSNLDIYQHSGAEVVLKDLRQYNIVFVKDAFLIGHRNGNENLCQCCRFRQTGNLLELLQNGAKEFKMCIAQHSGLCHIIIKDMLIDLLKMAQKNQGRGKIIYYKDRGYLFNKVKMTDLERWCGKDSVDYLCEYFEI